MPTEIASDNAQNKACRQEKRVEHAQSGQSLQYSAAAVCFMSAPCLWMLLFRQPQQIYVSASDIVTK